MKLPKANERFWRNGFFDFVSGVKQDAITFLEKLQLFTLAESLGGVESGESSCLTTLPS
jgi:cystathionine beta-lyase/cystathionine gamma-synthase